jgi:phage shock protein PspC (stress-responsive transcriptional regulator)
MAEMKSCPYCAEEILAAATRCRYCRSRLVTFDTDRWHRSHPDRRVAGVCTALAHALAVPTAAVRLAFVVLTFFHLLGPLVYLGLWLVIPRHPGGESQLERLFRLGQGLAATLSGRRNGPPVPPSVPDRV